MKMLRCKVHDQRLAKEPQWELDFALAVPGSVYHGQKATSSLASFDTL